MMYEGDWLIDPDGRACEDRKNGPVTSYKLTPEELEKYRGGKSVMGCKCAVRTDEYHGWKCDITGGECMFLIPDSKACAKIYGEGPDADASKEGEKVMTEATANYEVMGLSKDPVKEPEKKRMTEKVVREMAANGMTEDQIVEHFSDGSTRQSMTKAKVILYLKPDEPKEEKPVEVTSAEEPIEVIGTEELIHDFWDGVKHELWGMKEAEFDQVNEDFLKVLARWVGGDHSEETTAALMFYGEKVLNV